MEADDEMPATVVNEELDANHKRVIRYAETFPEPVSGGGIVSVNACVWSTLLGAQESLDVRGDLLEIGVWYGHGTAFGAMYRRPEEKLVVFDKFMKVEEFLPNIMKTDPGADEALVYMNGCSFAAKKEQRAAAFRNRVRWAHIDGEHSYEAVINDLDLVADLMTEDGIVIIDDFFSFASPAITEATFAWLRRNEDKLVMFLCGYFKAYLCSPRKLRQYLAACHSLPERMAVHGHKTMLCMSGWSVERPYFGLDTSWTGHHYQRIGAMEHDASLAELFFRV